MHRKFQKDQAVMTSETVRRKCTNPKELNRNDNSLFKSSAENQTLKIWINRLGTFGLTRNPEPLVLYGGNASS